MKTGFFLKKLTLTGPAKKAISIPFKLGLNVIEGGSNTGKSFIFQCIDFMMGSKKSPKSIDESKDYQEVILEVETYRGQQYTLKRNLNAGVFKIKLGDIDSANPYIEYVEKLTKKQENISTFLLELCDLETIQLKKNSSNKKIRLSFRDVAGLCLVDESTIITENSPVNHSGESTARTKEQSLFSYFILGEDATMLTEAEDPKLLKNKLAGKIELIKELIEKTNEKLEEFKGKNIESLEAELEMLYERLNLEYSTTISEIDKLRNEKASFYQSVEKYRNKHLFNTELLQRFTLLEQHYINDKRRLEFISEGSFLFNQLLDVICPICGSEITDNHKIHVHEFIEENENFEEAILKELEKITLKQIEIADTIVQLNKEVGKYSNNIERLEKKLIDIDDKLNNSLTPVTHSLRERLQTISIEKAAIEKYTSLRGDMELYSQQLNIYEDLSKQKIKNNEDAILQQQQGFSDFCAQVESVLNEWKFPDVTNVTFDSKSTVFDIKINNAARATNGKGYRAITYSAFTFALMRYCDDNDRSHPNFLVLDSPLTTFKGQDADKSSNDDDVGIDVENAFFESMSKIGKTSQVIILENKEPSDKIKERIHYIHFSKIPGLGRRGFFE